MKEKKDKIVAFMKEEAYKPLKYEELQMVLDVKKDDVELFKTVIGELLEEGRIYKTHKDRYGVPEKMNLIAGRLQGNLRGYGFLVPDDPDMRDLFIPADSLGGAMNNDRVIARITGKALGDKRAEGEIIRVLKRANRTIVGTYESSRYFGFVIPDDKRVPGDIFIPKDEVNGAKPGQKVVAEIVKWPEKRRNAEGRIVEIIGDVGKSGTDILSIIKSYDLNEDFPEEVLQQAAEIPETVSSEMSAGRKDLRSLRMVTIDGEDAKDLDDAVSVERLDSGRYRLGVHIADVSHYVTQGSPLDEEAYRRATSVYLVDRVIPMLPKKLSNGICSLNPRIDRLSFTVMMDIDTAGKVVSHEIFESVINIDERMTYTNVYKILEENDTELSARYEYLLEDFTTMKELALILRKKRMARGAIDFDFDEAKIILDEKGKPVEIKRYITTIANKIIEEFMLVCNETVAEHFHWADVPFVYRIHEEPDPEKIQAFAEFSSNMGLPLKGINKIHPRALQEILEKVKGSREETIISTVMLRSLAKARYSHLNAGHFGLAAKFYSHFTSPIRRYPDLIIHRIMKESLFGRLEGKKLDELVENLPEITRHCSERERAAEEAERETEDLKKVEYMKSHEGEVFEGIISNVTSFGMFVELDNTIEGLVKVSNMDDDYYIFDEKNFCLIGERTRKRYRIGDAVHVRLARADIEARQIDFVIEEPDRMEDNNGFGHFMSGMKAKGVKRKTAAGGKKPGVDMFEGEKKPGVDLVADQKKGAQNGIQQENRVARKKNVDKRVIDKITGKSKKGKAAGKRSVSAAGKGKRKL